MCQSRGAYFEALTVVGVNSIPGRNFPQGSFSQRVGFIVAHDLPCVEGASCLVWLPAGLNFHHLKVRWVDVKIMVPFWVP